MLVTTRKNLERKKRAEQLHHYLSREKKTGAAKLLSNPRNAIDHHKEPSI